MSQLDHYLPQPGLLDPSLNETVPPLMDAVAGAVDVLASSNSSKNVSKKRLSRLGSCVNWVVKVRGWKSVGE